MHSWQDIILSIGSLFFIAGLLPSVLSQNKPAVTTSITNALVLLTFTITYATLSLWFAAVTTAITAGLWAVLAFQKSHKR